MRNHRTHNTPPLRNKSVIFRFLVVSNIFLVIVVIALLLNMFGILHNPFSSEKQRTYLDNWKWNTFNSIFQLNNAECDIVFAGDSLTEMGHFSEYFHTDKSILNRGIGGDITEGLYHRIDEILSHNPSKIFIMTGINDISGGIIKQEETLHYYELIIESIHKSAPETEIIVQSILPVLLDYNSKVDCYNQALLALSDKHGCTYVDINSLFYDNGSVNPAYYARDGLHLNGAGYKVWMDAIQPLL